MGPKVHSSDICTIHQFIDESGRPATSIHVDRHDSPPGADKKDLYFHDGRKVSHDLWFSAISTSTESGRVFSCSEKFGKQYPGQSRQSMRPAKTSPRSTHDHKRSVSPVSRFQFGNMQLFDIDADGRPDLAARFNKSGFQKQIAVSVVMKELKALGMDVSTLYGSELTQAQKTYRLIQDAKTFAHKADFESFSQAITALRGHSLGHIKDFSKIEKSLIKKLRAANAALIKQYAKKGQPDKALERAQRAVDSGLLDAAANIKQMHYAEKQIARYPKATLSSMAKQARVFLNQGDLLAYEQWRTRLEKSGLLSSKQLARFDLSVSAYIKQEGLIEQHWVAGFAKKYGRDLVFHSGTRDAFLKQRDKLLYASSKLIQMMAQHGLNSQSAQSQLDELFQTAILSKIAKLESAAQRNQSSIQNQMEKSHYTEEQRINWEMGVMASMIRKMIDRGASESVTKVLLKRAYEFETKLSHGYYRRPLRIASR